MTTNTQSEALQLNNLKTPALQARYAELVGKPSRCPNRTFLIRTILAAVENAPQQGEAEPVEEKVQPEAEPAEVLADAEPVQVLAEGEQVEVQAEAEVVDAEPESDPQLEPAVEPGVELAPQPLTELEIEPAIEPAINPIMEVGVVPSKPARQRAATFKVLPVRMENALVEQLDEAWKRQGLRSRMDLFRRALQVFFINAGEVELAAQFAPEDA